MNCLSDNLLIIAYLLVWRREYRNEIYIFFGWVGSYKIEKPKK